MPLSDHAKSAIRAYGDAIEYSIRDKPERLLGDNEVVDSFWREINVSGLMRKLKHRVVEAEACFDNCEPLQLQAALVEVGAQAMKVWDKLESSKEM